MEKLIKNIQYYYSKFFKKVLRGKSIRNSVIDKTAIISSGCSISNSRIGRYSYCGYDCEFINCLIGNFCSISDSVFIGGGEHPVHWVSTSPAFQSKNHGPHGLKHLSDYELPTHKLTTIGNDVWIGHGVSIKQGVTIGNGAVIGTGAVVTKDVPPYAIVGGIPAKVIKYRFDEETIVSLLHTEWWSFSDEDIKQHVEMIKNPKEFVIKLKETHKQK